MAVVPLIEKNCTHVATRRKLGALAAVGRKNATSSKRRAVNGHESVYLIFQGLLRVFRENESYET
jgi:hypothetical protein